MRLHSTRSLAAAGSLLVVAYAVPAFAADPPNADIGVTLTADGDFDTTTTPPLPTPATAGFTVGSEKTYIAKVTNNGNVIVTEFLASAAIDAAASTTYTLSDNCTKTTQSGSTVTCKWTGTLNPGDSTEITFGATYPLPKPLSSGTCPNGAVTLTSSVTVSSPKSGDVVLTDSDPANDSSGPVTSKLRNWTDLEVVSFDGPANISQGGTYTYTAVVKNLGPCPAPNVRVSFSPDGSLSYADGSAVGCTNGAGSAKPQFGAADNCDVVADGDANALAVGASKTASAGFTATNWPKSQLQGAASNAVSVSSRTVEISKGPPAVWSVGADDPNSDNDSGSTTAPVDFSGNGGCSTGGAGGVLAGLLALAALRLGRRRAKA